MTASIASIATIATIALSSPHLPAALAGGYGTSLSYFERLERERVISEEPQTMAERDARAGARGRLAAAPSPSSARGVPLSLNAADDGTEDGAYSDLFVKSDPVGDGAAEDERRNKIDVRRWGRAAFQWGVIAAVAIRMRQANDRSSKVTKRLGLEGAASKALIGTRWRLTLDVGRERGTWMPPSWAASGVRVVAPIAIELAEGGVTRVVATGAFLPMKLSEGRWRLEGDALKFDVLMTTGMEKGDVTLPANESLHFRASAWGGAVSSRGTLLLRQTRWGFRKEWRMVGVFKAEKLSDGEDGVGDDQDYSGSSVFVDLPPMRVKQSEVR